LRKSRQTEPLETAEEAYYSLPYTLTRMPMHPRDRRSEAFRRGHCAPKVRDVRPPPRPVLRGCRAHAGAAEPASPSSIGCQPCARHQPPRRPCRDPCGHWWSPNRPSSRVRAYKPHPLHSCARQQLATARRLRHYRHGANLPLYFLSKPSKHLSSTPRHHSYSNAHAWLSSTPHYAGTRAAAAPPPLSRRRPSSGTSPAPTLPQSEPR
jgi:hypothetical protein